MQSSRTEGPVLIRLADVQVEEDWESDVPTNGPRMNCWPMSKSGHHFVINHGILIESSRTDGPRIRNGWPMSRLRKTYEGIKTLPMGQVT
jgi:hypothetical protein